MNFKEGLKNSEFLLSECKNCKKIVWPPSEFCDKCFQKNSWKKSSGIGKVVEFSRKDRSYFCVVEIEKSIRIIGEIVSGLPKIGSKVKILECGIKNGNYFFKLNILE